MFNIKENLRFYKDFISKEIGLELSIFFIFIPLFYLLLIERSLTILHCYDLPNIHGYITITLGFLIAIIVLIYYFAKLRNNKKLRLALLILLVAIFSVVNFLIMAKRDKQLEGYGIHDSVVLTEEAVDFIVAGKNPYEEDYYNTRADVASVRYLPLVKNYDPNITVLLNPHVQNKELTYLEEAKELARKTGQNFLTQNPALENFVYPPLSFLIAIPFKYPAEKLFGTFDNRMILWLAFIVSLFIIYKLPKENNKKMAALVFLALNPFLLSDIIYGINDMLPLLFLLLSILLLKQEKYKTSIVIVSLACLIKQNILFYIPFILFYIFLKKEYKLNIKSVIKFIKYPLWLLPAVILILVPFLLWSPMHYYQDTVYYLGNVYPARGLGLGGLLVSQGVISNFGIHPFFIYQLIFTIITLPLLLKKQYKKNSLRNVFLLGTILMAGVWILSRYFHSSHAAVIITHFIIALLI